MSLALKDFASSATVSTLAANAFLAPASVQAAEGMPIAPKTCFTTDSSGQAVDKLRAALKARDQKLVLTADQAVPFVKDGKRVLSASGDPVTLYKENYFTSSPDWKEGYNVVSDSPSGEAGSSYCIKSLYTKVKVYNAYTLNDVPSEVNKGELGKALRGEQSINRNVAMTAETVGGNVFAVVVDTKDPNAYGSMTLAGIDGNKAGGLADFRQVVYAKGIASSLGIRYSEAEEKK